jgi:hypothetical protein
MIHQFFDFPYSKKEHTEERASTVRFVKFVFCDVPFPNCDDISRHGTGSHSQEGKEDEKGSQRVHFCGGNVVVEPGGVDGSMLLKLGSPSGDMRL